MVGKRGDGRVGRRKNVNGGTLFKKIEEGVSRGLVVWSRYY